MTRVYHVLKFLNDSKIKDGRDVIADNPQHGPSTSKTNANFGKVGKLSKKIVP